MRGVVENFTFIDTDADFDDWNTDLTQTGSGVRCSTVRQVNLGNVSLRIDRTNVAHTARCSLLSGKCILFFPPTSRGQTSWCGRALPPGSVILVPPGQHLVKTQTANSMGLELHISTDLVVETGISLEMLLTGRGSQQVAFWEPGPEVSALRRQIEALGKATAPLNLQRDKSVAEMIGNTLSGADCHLLRPSRRHETALAAMELIGRETKDELRVQTIACRLGVSERALEYSLRDVCGVSPHRFIKHRKLQHVRKQIVTTDATVTSAFSEVGVSNFGYFAGQYRHLFGESPSETARSRRHQSTA